MFGVCCIKQEFFLASLVSPLAPIGQTQGVTNSDISNKHLPVPVSREFVKYLAGQLVLYGTPDSIVRSGEVTFGLELQIGHKVIFRTSDKAVISEFILHFTKQDPSGIHVWLRQCTRLAELIGRAGQFLEGEFILALTTAFLTLIQNR